MYKYARHEDVSSRRHSRRTIWISILSHSHFRTTRTRNIMTKPVRIKIQPYINNSCKKSVGIRRSFWRQSACEFIVAVWAGIARRNSGHAYRSLVSGRWIRPPPRRCYARAKVIWSVVSARRSFDSEASALASRLAESHDEAQR